MPAVVPMIVTVLAGAILAFQAPINATLSKTTGVLEGVLISFLAGLAVLVVATLCFGRGDLRSVMSVPPWQLLGGVLGAVFVTIFVFSVPRIGVSTALACSIAGQLSTAILIDHFGLIGVAQRTADVKRLLAIPALALGVWLMQGR